YLESAGYTDNIYHLITYGTPHLGIPHANWSETVVTAAECGGGLTSLFLDSVGFQELTQDSPFLHTLNDGVFPPNVLYTSLIGDHSPFRGPWWCSYLIP